MRERERDIIPDDNIHRLIDTEQPSTIPLQLGWKAYYTLQQINDWLDEQLLAHPDILTNLTVGKSYEGRTIRAIKLAHNSVSSMKCAHIYIYTVFAIMHCGSCGIFNILE